jgi:hypothetical protein
VFEIGDADSRIALIPLLVGLQVFGTLVRETHCTVYRLGYCLRHYVDTVLTSYGAHVPDSGVSTRREKERDKRQENICRGEEEKKRKEKEERRQGRGRVKHSTVQYMVLWVVYSVPRYPNCVSVSCRAASALGSLPRLPRVPRCAGGLSTASEKGNTDEGSPASARRHYHLQYGFTHINSTLYRPLRCRSRCFGLV